MYIYIYISATLSSQLAYIRFIPVHSATNETTTAGRPWSYIFNPAINKQKNKNNKNNTKDSQKYTNKISTACELFHHPNLANSHLQQPQGWVVLSEFSNFHRFTSKVPISCAATHLVMAVIFGEALHTT